MERKRKEGKREESREKALRSHGGKGQVRQSFGVGCIRYGRCNSGGFIFLLYVRLAPSILSWSLVVHIIYIRDTSKYRDSSKKTHPFLFLGLFDPALILLIPHLLWVSWYTLAYFVLCVCCVLCTTHTSHT